MPNESLTQTTSSSPRKALNRQAIRRIVDAGRQCAPYGHPRARRLYHLRPLTILDTPEKMQRVALVADAIGHGLFHRGPVTAYIILAGLEAGKATHDALTANV